MAIYVIQTKDTGLGIGSKQRYQATVIKDGVWVKQFCSNQAAVAQLDAEEWIQIDQMERAGEYQYPGHPPPPPKPPVGAPSTSERRDPVRLPRMDAYRVVVLLMLTVNLLLTILVYAKIT